MTKETVLCDECGRTKGESNHWHRVGVWKENGKVVAVLGASYVGIPSPVGIKTEIHDLCGDECFHKHIAKLMGFTEERQAQNVS